MTATAIFFTNKFRFAYLPKYWKLKSLCQWVLEIQPAVITTFALSDLMALFAQKYHAPPAVAESSCFTDSI